MNYDLINIYLDDAKVLLESIGAEVLRNDTQETAQKLVDNVDELEQTISALDKKYNELMICEKELEKVEEEIDKQIKEMTKYDILHKVHCFIPNIKKMKLIFVRYWYFLVML